MANIMKIARLTKTPGRYYRLHIAIDYGPVQTGTGSGLMVSTLMCNAVLWWQAG
ncbi:MAG: hypothetical protein J7599_10815 [Niabella sp.]|nr:hypothetical protein [Niabella sp.]